MKFGHLLFPVLFFILLGLGAAWIMRTVEEVSFSNTSQTVYLDSNERSIEVTAESVGSTREKAHQAFNRFSEPLVENGILSDQDRENLMQILQLGEGHWGGENWAPAFYAFERVPNDLNPLIDEGLGQEKATDMEARYSDLSQSLSSEVILVEATYLQAIETANDGYNELLDKDWVGAIQSFAKAIDTLNLVKAQSTEILNSKFKAAYEQIENGDLDAATELFNEVLSAVPYSEDAQTGLELIEAERTRLTEAEIVLTAESQEPIPSMDDPIPDPEQLDHPKLAEADRHFERRELKESLKLYLEVQSKEPDLPGLEQRIARTRKVLRSEELTRLMDRASILTDLEQWDAVVKTYRHILNVDPVNREARRGWEEALVGLVGQKQVEQYRSLVGHHLNNYQFIHAREVYLEARNVLHERKNLDELFLTLSNELEKQLTPVELRIESDGETWVSIPGKLAPEQFKEKIITIFPGKLELLGWRKGYERDYQFLQFNIEDAPASVSVVCDTKIKRISYSKKSGEQRLTDALKAHHLEGVIEDPDFTSQFLSSPLANASLNSSSQLNAWDQAFYSGLYIALTQETEQQRELTHLEARGQFIQVPEVLSRQETIELGQYLASLN